MQRPCFTRIREQRIISITFKQRFSFLFLDTWKLKSDSFNLIFIYFYLINWLIDLWHRFLVYLKIKFFKRWEAFSRLVIGRFMLQFLPSNHLTCPFLQRVRKSLFIVQKGPKCRMLLHLSTWCGSCWCASSTKTATVLMWWCATHTQIRQITFF